MLVKYTNEKNFETNEFKVTPFNEHCVDVTNLTDHLLGFIATDYSDPEDPEGPIGLKVTDDLTSIKHGFVLIPGETRHLTDADDIFFDDPEVNNRSNQEKARVILNIFLNNIDACLTELTNYVPNAEARMEQASDEPIPDDIKDDIAVIGTAIKAGHDLIKKTRSFYQIPEDKPEEDDELDVDDFDPID